MELANPSSVAAHCCGLEAMLLCMTKTPKDLDWVDYVVALPPASNIEPFEVTDQISCISHIMIHNKFIALK